MKKEWVWRSENTEPEELWWVFRPLGLQFGQSSRTEAFRLGRPGSRCRPIPNRFGGTKTEWMGTPTSKRALPEGRTQSQRVKGWDPARPT